MDKKIVTILIPNYKTLQITQLCLRLLRKHTDLEKTHIIVIDNDSQDESTEYLRKLKWIELIERKKEKDDTPPLSHSRALDAALQKVNTKYVLVIHTDTFVKNDKWLNYLLSHFESDENISAVGSWKLESKTLLQKILKSIERKIQLWWYFIINKKDHAIEGVGKNFYYLRSHCALYKMDLIKKYHLSFSDENETAGKMMHKKLIEKGHKIIFLPSKKLNKYIEHVNHATMILNKDFNLRKRTITKGEKQIQKLFAMLQAEKILKDDSLDYL